MRIKIFIATLLLMIATCISATAAEPTFELTKSTATVTDAPENASMIVALYKDNLLADTEIYNETGTITANYAEDMKDTIDSADSIKLFLWDFSKMVPLATAYSKNVSDLSDETVNRVLTVYFSATGNTKSLAEKVANVANSDIVEIIPETLYTSADLNYSDSNCRANQEQNDPNARPKIANTISNIEDYDVIILGYPIWWSTMPKIINTFLETYDLSVKTIMPFCTSGSSGIATSVSAIKGICTNSTVTTGFRGTSSTTDTDIQKWFDSVDFNNAVCKRMKLTANEKEIIIKLNSNATTADLISTLPCELDFSDFNNTEKIAYPTKTLDTSDTQSGTTPSAGDL
ncbi:MAG: flavodoxin, partial [Clostridia bacterium]|nr:flavodoxin [Clostridia bacterium]